MAVSVKAMSFLVLTFGVISFIFGVIAEVKKPKAGTSIQGKGLVIRKYPSHPTVVLGYLSTLFLLASAAVGYFSLFYPYHGKSVPRSVIFKSSSFAVFFNIALDLDGSQNYGTRVKEKNFGIGNKQKPISHKTDDSNRRLILRRSLCQKGFKCHDDYSPVFSPN